MCNRRYTKTTIQDRTTFDERRFPKYKRSKDEDLTLVPHSRGILMDWNGHANCEFAGSTYLVIYLYKYLFKGAKNVKFDLTNAADVDDKNEIKLYERGRYLCSMDAVWRI